MRIQEYRYLGNSKYNIVIDGSDYVLYEDIILKYNLLTKDSINDSEIAKYIEENKMYWFLGLKK